MIGTSRTKESILRPHSINNQRTFTILSTAAYVYQIITATYFTHNSDSRFMVPKNCTSKWHLPQWQSWIVITPTTSNDSAPTGSFTAIVLTPTRSVYSTNDSYSKYAYTHFVPSTHGSLFVFKRMTATLRVSKNDNFSNVVSSRQLSSLSEYFN